MRAFHKAQEQYDRDQLVGLKRPMENTVTPKAKKQRVGRKHSPRQEWGRKPISFRKEGKSDRRKSEPVRHHQGKKEFNKPISQYPEVSDFHDHTTMPRLSVVQGDQVEGELLVPVRVHSSHKGQVFPITALIDTGSYYPIIDIRVAEEQALNLVHEVEEVVLGIDNQRGILRGHTLINLGCGSHMVPELKVRVAELGSKKYGMILDTNTAVQLGAEFKMPDPNARPREFPRSIAAERLYDWYQEKQQREGDGEGSDEALRLCVGVGR